MAHSLCVRITFLQARGVSESCQAKFLRLRPSRPCPLSHSRCSPFRSPFSSVHSRREQDEGSSKQPPLPTPPSHPLSTAPRERPTAILEQDVSPSERNPEGTESASHNVNSKEQADNTADDSDEGVRIPRSVQAIYLKPLRRKAEYGLPCCDLQIRSYSVRNLEFMADFALRAAYYLHLPARGPVPLPRITERWTVPRGNFVHKKSQENFERITMRRLIQILDGHPETVEIWLAFLRKHAYYGVGMKANVWEHEKLGVGKTMDVSLENLRKSLEPKWAHFGRRKNLDTSEKAYQMMTSDTFRQTSDGPLSQTP